MSMVPRIAAILIVEDGDIRLRVAEDVEVMIEGIVEVAVRITLHVDLLQNGKGFGIEHRHGLRSCESVAGCGIDRCAVCACARDISHLG